MEVFYLTSLTSKAAVLLEFNGQFRMRRLHGAVLLMLFMLLAVPCQAQEVSDSAIFDEFQHEFADDIDADAQPPAVYDPLEPYNRLMFGVNDKLYLWIFRPVAQIYANILPEPPRVAVARFFKNLRFPVHFVNNLLQADFGDAGVECARFGLNTTIGILGFFDPAEKWYNLTPREEDFGQTLGRYGVGGGAPLVLPLFGPSNLRDTLGRIPDSFLHPISYVEPTGVRLSIRIYEMENSTSLRLGEYEELKAAALDPYALFRDAYKQRREQMIKR